MQKVIEDRHRPFIITNVNDIIINVGKIKILKLANISQGYIYEIY